MYFKSYINDSVLMQGMSTKLFALYREIRLLDPKPPAPHCKVGKGRDTNVRGLPRLQDNSLRRVCSTSGDEVLTDKGCSVGSDRNHEVVNVHVPDNLKAEIEARDSRIVELQLQIDELKQVIDRTRIDSENLPGFLSGKDLQIDELTKANMMLSPHTHCDPRQGRSKPGCVLP